MYRAAIILTFLLHQVVSNQAKCKFLNETEEFIRVNYTFNQQNEIGFGSLEISGFENLENFFCNCNLEPNDKVEFSLQYKSNKLWKPLGKPFEVLNNPGRNLDEKPINVEIHDR